MSINGRWVTPEPRHMPAYIGHIEARREESSPAAGLVAVHDDCSDAIGPAYISESFAARFFLVGEDQAKLARNSAVLDAI